MIPVMCSFILNGYEYVVSGHEMYIMIWRSWVRIPVGSNLGCTVFLSVVVEPKSMFSIRASLDKDHEPKNIQFIVHDKMRAIIECCNYRTITPKCITRAWMKAFSTHQLMLLLMHGF